MRTLNESTVIFLCADSRSSDNHCAIFFFVELKDDEK